MRLTLASCLFFLLLFARGGQAAIDPSPLVDSFVTKMVDEHHFERSQVLAWLKSAEIQPAILKSISAPAEGISWFKYRKIFLTDKRIEGGVRFWRDNAAALQEVSVQYGVPKEIIIAIIGVETQYGGNAGHYRVIDALATLGFAYPKRSPFFLSELENFLLLCREEHKDPLKPLGSYAGAMGLPQFMPSSYRNFAVDFEQDKQRDIWTNPADAIASVANYFTKHHWQTGGEVFIPALAEGDAYKDAIRSELEPDTTIAELKKLGVSVVDKVPEDSRVKLLAFKQEHGEDLWLGLDNYYVITRYNHSPLYAMAVYQLSQAILDKKQLNIVQNQ